MAQNIPLDPDAPWAKVYRELNLSLPSWDGRSLHDVLSDHVGARPQNAALQYFDRTFSYAEFEEYAQRLANGLAAQGVGPGDVVGVHLPNTPQYAFAIVAISKLGAIGSGVSQLLSPPELVYQINDANMKALITFDNGADALRNAAIPNCLEAIIVTSPHYHLDADANTDQSSCKPSFIDYGDLLDKRHPIAPPVERDGDETFMIQYTGGTTGRPKGAELSVRTIMYNPIQAGLVEEPWDLGKEVYVTPFPMFHIAGLSGLIGFVLSGGHGFLIPDPRDVETTCRLMKKFPPTRLGAVPALYQMYLQTPAFREIDFSRLKLARSGAAPMPTALVEELVKVIGPNKFADAYGMTETGPCYTAHPPTRYKIGSVGFVMPGADIKIVDVETGEKELPIGEPGEICTAGPQVMKGYLNLPEETAKALRESNGKIWMHSGDVGYMDDEGYIFLCDRAKDMLIVGGFKVFSVEVEDKLNHLPEIQSCAVIGKPDEKRLGNEIVTLFVQPTDPNADHGALRDTILDFCRENLAPFKTPKEIHFLDTIPLTQVGKIDKKALRTPV